MHRSAYALTLLLLASCLSARDHALFEAVPDSSVAGAGLTSSVGASAGTGSGANPPGNGSSAALGMGASSAGPAGGSGGAASLGGASGSGGSTAGDNGANDAPPVEVPVITDCAMVEGAVVGDNGHCYRVDESELTFSAASAACQAAGGHLVTIADEAENELAAALHDGEHWLGASDGLVDTAPGVGTYSWVVEEAFSYSDWEEGQPNAYETDCPDQDDEADCFEHCAFQTDEGDWNDRSCWHAIASICEWDVEGPPPAGGSAGAPSADPLP
jgi:hypothetical protein